MGIINILIDKISHYTWDIAYGKYTDSITNNGLDGLNIHVVKNPYKTKWFADPFILEETDKELHLLVEEYDTYIKKGRIAHIVIDKENDIISDCVIILELSTHLSFPAIYIIDNMIYVHPENYKSGCSYMYKYNRKDKVLEAPINILSEPIADAVIQNLGSCFRLYATVAPDLNGSELVIYESNTFFGPYVRKDSEYYCNNTARMAGMYIQTGNGVIRPAQDCSDAYGKAVIFYRGEKQVGRIDPPGHKYCGLHTFNSKGSTFVIDLKKRDYPIIYILMKKIKRVYENIVLYSVNGRRRSRSIISDNCE